MAKSVKPSAGYLLVEDLNHKDETQMVSGSSLEVSGTNPHDQLKFGKVVKAGPMPIRTVKALRGEFTKAEIAEATPAKVGDIITYQSLSAHALRIEGKQYRLVEFDHVIAIIEEGK